MKGYYEELGEKYSVVYDKELFYEASFGDPSYELVEVITSNSFEECLDKALELDKIEKNKYYIFDNDATMIITINDALLYMCSGMFE
jgi:hypothetical protein